MYLSKGTTMKEPNIYFDFTLMTGTFSISLFATPKWTLLDIRFSTRANQIIVFNKELYFKYKGIKDDV